MSTREQFFPNKPHLVSDPTELPIAVGSGAVLTIKTGTNTLVAADVAGFFTNIAYGGASSAITVADTYVTVCDITGAGVMYNAVTPTHSAVFTPTIKITVDGRIYTITTSSTISSPYRMALGVTTAGVLGSAGTGDTAANGVGDVGFNAAYMGGYYNFATTIQGIATPHRCLAERFTGLRFNSSLKVEMKASLLSATAEHKQCAVTYMLDN